MCHVTRGDRVERARRVFDDQPSELVDRARRAQEIGAPGQLDPNAPAQGAAVPRDEISQAARGVKARGGEGRVVVVESGEIGAERDIHDVGLACADQGERGREVRRPRTPPPRPETRT